MSKAEVITSSDWKAGHFVAQMERRNVEAGVISLELNAPEPHSECVLKVGSGKLTKFVSRPDVASKLNETSGMQLVNIIDVNGIHLKDGRPDGVITTGRGVVSGVQKATQTARKMHNNVAIYSGEKGAQIGFQNIVTAGEYEEGTLSWVVPIVESGVVTLSLPFLEYLADEAKLQSLVEVGRC